jgi:hypothetical protein
MIKTETISSKVRNDKGVTLPSLSTVLEFLSREIRQEEEINRIQIGKEEVKLSLLAGEMTLYLKDLKNAIKNALRHHKHFLKSSRI